MYALGHKPSRHVRGMSALPPKADIGGRHLDVRFVPKAGIDGLHGPLANVLVFDRNYVTFGALRLQMFTVHFERYFGCPC